MEEGTGLTAAQYANLVSLYWDREGYQGLDDLATAEELHQFAWTYNWDDGVDYLRSVINNPACDRGTALLVYWRAGPRWYCDYASRDAVPEYELKKYDFVIELQRLYLADAFTSRRIRFDPADDEGTDWTAQYTDRQERWRIPDEMRAPTPGVALRRASH